MISRSPDTVSSATFTPTTRFSPFSNIVW